MFALALSGGGVLGAAHLGALQFLEEQKVSASAVAGTSSGGLAAALYALGVPTTEVIRVGAEISTHPHDYFRLNTRDLMHDIWPRSGNPATGLLTADRLVQALLQLAPEAKTTDDWKIPAVLTSVDVVRLGAVAFTNQPSVRPSQGRWTIAASQPLALAMEATIAFPGLFAAPRWGNAVLVDGGVADTMPIDWAYALHPRFVVAVDVAVPTPVDAGSVGLAEVLTRAETYATSTLSDLRAGPAAHITVRPQTGNVHFFGFADYGRLVESGWHAMKAAWPRIRDNAPL